MAGVKSNSVGGSPAYCCAALLESAERIRGAPKPVVSISNGRRLGGGGGGAFMGFVQRKNLDSSGDSRFHSRMDRAILDRTNILSSAQGKYLFCNLRDPPVVYRDTHQRIQPEDQRIFHQKRGT